MVLTDVTVTDENGNPIPSQINEGVRISAIYRDLEAKLDMLRPEQRRLLEAFIAAAQKADMAALEGLFAEDVVSTSDGGGIVRAARVPVCGRERVAKFIATAAHFWNGVKLTWVEANGQAAVLVSRDGVPVAVTTIDASAQGIDQIVWILRPSKLAAISKSVQRLGDVPGPAAA